VLFGFSGCLSLKLKKNRANVEHIIEKLEIAIAGFIEKLKNTITKGIATPPPPIPPTLLRSMTNAKTNEPTISRGSIGNSGLCLHYFSVSPSISIHRSYGLTA
jgi:hypothetical protein